MIRRRRAKCVRDDARVVGRSVARDVVSGATGGGVGDDHFFVRAVVVAREGVAVRATGARACGDVGCVGRRVAVGDI